MTQEDVETPPRPLFRPEAVEAHARGRGADDEGLELREGQTAWTFRILILLLVLAIAVAFTVRVSETARGQAKVVGGRVVVELPVAAGPRINAGDKVRLGELKGKVSGIGGPVTHPNGVTVVEIFATFDEGNPTPGKATVELSRQTLADLLRRKSG